MHYPKGLFGVAQGRATRAGDVIEFSVRTGRPHILFRPPAVWDKGIPHDRAQLLRGPAVISNSGQQILVTCSYPRPAGHALTFVPHAVLLDHGRAIQLPWLDQVLREMTAFGS